MHGCLCNYFQLYFLTLWLLYRLREALPWPKHCSLFISKPLTANSLKLGLKCLQKEKLIWIRWFAAKKSKYDQISYWIKEMFKEEWWNRRTKIAKLEAYHLVMSDCIQLINMLCQNVLKFVSYFLLLKHLVIPFIKLIKKRGRCDRFGKIWRWLDMWPNFLET